MLMGTADMKTEMMGLPISERKASRRPTSLCLCAFEGRRAWSSECTTRARHAAEVLVHLPRYYDKA